MVVVLNPTTFSFIERRSKIKKKKCEFFFGHHIGRQYHWNDPDIHKLLEKLSVKINRLEEFLHLHKLKKILGLSYDCLL